jgi:type I restriction enzyme S subunit
MSSELRNRWEHAGGRIPEEWEIVSLENLLLDSKSITVGVMYPGADTIGGVPLIKVGDIKQGYIPNKPSYCISAETNLEHKRSQLQGEELLITLVGNPGECVVVTPRMIGWNPARAIATVRLKDSTLRVYLKTVLESAAGKHMIDAVLNTTVQKTLNLKDIKQLPIPMPPSATIKALSEFSQALSDRITLLRETNATLEAIAQALFKSWFVDFDPVHAKQQGRLPEGMDEQTAALFPDSFEESDLGLVPAGWEISALYDLAEYINGAAYKAFEPNLERQGLPIIKIAELKAGVTNQTAFSDVKMAEKFRINMRDILFSWSGNPDTSIDTFVWSHETAWLNQHIFRVVPNSDNERSFVLLTLKYMKPIFAEIARNKQTTGLGHVTVADLKRLQIIKPSLSVLQKWSEIVDPIVEQMFMTKQQAKTLADLRDTLLPRLISGQLRVGGENKNE